MFCKPKLGTPSGVQHKMFLKKILILYIKLTLLHTYFRLVLDIHLGVDLDDFELLTPYPFSLLYFLIRGPRPFVTYVRQKKTSCSGVGILSRRFGLSF